MIDVLCFLLFALHFFFLLRSFATVSRSVFNWLYFFFLFFYRGANRSTTFFFFPPSFCLSLLHFFFSFTVNSAGVLTCVSRVCFLVLKGIFFLSFRKGWGVSVCGICFFFFFLFFFSLAALQVRMGYLGTDGLGRGGGVRGARIDLRLVGVDCRSLSFFFPFFFFSARDVFALHPRALLVV